MTREALRELLLAVRQGSCTPEAALAQLAGLPAEPLVGDDGQPFATLDHGRALRQGFPEVVYGASKTPEQVAAIVGRLYAHHPNLLVTRASEAAYQAVQALAPEARWDATSRLLFIRRDTTRYGIGRIVVVCAGTTDLPVAREALLTCEVMGNETTLVADVGVAGLHRLLGHLETLRQARVIVCVAGMEAALASVVGGLVAVPVIAVPTSVGYGTALGGFAALLGMLNSCAPNVTVVNIDNGFGAGYVAALINRQPGIQESTG
ncbi:nickel pincer cofactor biosynthesis protein LarB [Chloracidobacterium thermophilum]|jgi:NCAIR mutase (PurE)-related protein|uniref:NCAIR mutase (PurE)-related protein n=1 Tax=Chloracidobacterium thermophilum (strain B) TaxID=981222 RepID=G2LDN9_CHLTF|nr:nickel pincer cofactor biosynthesis protein LarB [Chloracidobacterium thermophilum]AEP12897.1 NCAIR mutase (PurE)-related protein [Chloracidobacterium thermophilum B]QUV78617.1 nickel pincer cofactor biosynthesis protein LarB [Chloracidobacterium thermophilum]